MSALDLLSGDAQAFSEKVWASRSHVHHTDPDRLVGLLSFDDVDHLLTSSAIRTPAVRLAKDGEVLASSTFTRTGAVLGGQPLTGLVDGRKVVDLFEDGATVVLQGLHRYWLPLARLCSELELDLGHPCQANAYLTPPGSQGFAVHSDVHDVFVFQTHGSKLWEVHPAPGEAGEDAGAREVLLEPGVSMYLPSGTPHAARAQDTVSLHVTVGINQHTWSTLLDRAVRRARREVDDSGHLPAGHLERPELLQQGLADRLEQLAAAVRAADPADVVAAHQADFVTARNASLRGALVDRLALDEVTVDTALRRRPGKPCVVRRDEAAGQLHLYLGDRSVSLPIRIEESVTTLRRLLGEGSFTPGQLGLDDASALVLARRLVREGLLEVVRQPL